LENIGRVGKDIGRGVSRVQITVLLYHIS